LFITTWTEKHCTRPLTLFIYYTSVLAWT